MKIAIRTDASSVIGSGHVMRCLSLADALRERGATVHFICRAHENNLINLIRDRQYACSALGLPDGGAGDKAPAGQMQLPEHAPWLGVPWQRDAEETADILKEEACDRLIVDHYALDRRWESALRSLTGKIIVIDDLADREHDCDLLLDSVCGRQPEDYRGLTPDACRFLLGSRFVLLRSEFVKWRSAALERRKETSAVCRFLVTLGGVDPDNLTGAVLEQFAAADLPAGSEIEVILGSGFAHAGAVKKSAESMPIKTSISIGVDNMAERMARADFAITAGGVSALECCCLGLPAIVIVTAKNQQINMAMLKEKRMSEVISADSFASDFQPVLLRAIHDRQWHEHATLHGSRLVDGRGVARVAAVLTGENGRE